MKIKILLSLYQQGGATVEGREREGIPIDNNVIFPTLGFCVKQVILRESN